MRGLYGAARDASSGIGGTGPGAAAIFPARGGGNAGRAARAGETDEPHQWSVFITGEFVTHVPGLFCYRCPRPFSPGHLILASLDDLIRAQENRWRNYHPKRLGGL